MKFSRALEIVMAGGRVTRKGWNGKNQFVYMHKGNVAGNKPKTDLINGVGADLFTTGHEGTTTRMPNVNMHTADGSIVTGWIASQTDMFSQDWSEVE